MQQAGHDDADTCSTTSPISRLADPRGRLRPENAKKRSVSLIQPLRAATRTSPSKARIMAPPADYGRDSGAGAAGDVPRIGKDGARRADEIGKAGMDRTDEAPDHPQDDQARGDVARGFVEGAL